MYKGQVLLSVQCSKGLLPQWEINQQPYMQQTMNQMKIHQGQKNVMTQCRRWLGLSRSTYVVRWTTCCKRGEEKRMITIVELYALGVFKYHLYLTGCLQPREFVVR